MFKTIAFISTVLVSTAAFASESTIVPIEEVLRPPEPISIKGKIIVKRFSVDLVVQDDTGAIHVMCPLPLSNSVYAPQFGHTIIATGNYDGTVFKATECNPVEN